VIANHLGKVQELLNEKRTEYPTVVERYDKRTEQLAELAVDLAQLRSQKEREAARVEQKKEKVRRL
jgi:F0F1-type ATP synthase membrane subunit b/b'